MYTVNEIKELMAMGFTHEQIVAMGNDNKKSSKPTGATGMSKAEKWEHKKAEKQAEREEFYKTHTCVSCKIPLFRLVSQPFCVPTSLPCSYQ